MLPVIILEFASCSCHVPSVCHLGDLFYKFTAGHRLMENPAPCLEGEGSWTWVDTRSLYHGGHIEIVFIQFFIGYQALVISTEKKKMDTKPLSS